MNSNFLSLDWFDLLKGFITAIIGALLGSIYTIIQTGNIQWTWAFWQIPVYSALLAGISYLLKNFFTNSSGQPLKVEVK